MTAKLLLCCKCGGPVERKPGPGRPPSYCGETCKRLVEYELRRLDRRLAAYVLEQREVKAGYGEGQFDEERQKRLRALRRWIRQDEARLRELVGAMRGDGESDRSNQGGTS